MGIYSLWSSTPLHYYSPTPQSTNFSCALYTCHYSLPLYLNWHSCGPLHCDRHAIYQCASTLLPFDSVVSLPMNQNRFGLMLSIFKWALCVYAVKSLPSLSALPLSLHWDSLQAFWGQFTRCGCLWELECRSYNYWHSKVYNFPYTLCQSTGPMMGKMGGP